MPSHAFTTALTAALVFFVAQTSAQSVPASQAIPTATSTPTMNSLTVEGCWNSSGNMVDHGPYEFQSKGNCQPICYELNMPVMATANGTNCWCGTLLPPVGTKVNSDECNTPCNGIDTEMCGSATTWSVYLTGVTKNEIGNYDPSSSAAATSTSSVVTVGGSTVIVTAGDATGSSASKSSASSGGGSKVAVAVGVVVGVVGLAAIVGGIFFLLRRKKQKDAEDQYRRKNQISDFMGKREAPQTAHSHMNDSILDPEVMMSRRQSDGSIADNQDYSRRLRVTNPDDR